ncbi:MAG: hypothetical protein LBO74_09565 [Candidatus Symbiothrix sp.]|nr:hypothetical protein [Candidatus Symbiothrix sp.]
MDTLQSNTSVISTVLQIDNQLLWRWYREHLSGFRESEQDDHYQHDLHLSEKEVVRVPIFKPENIGEFMAIDEKQIGEDMHTILSNHRSGKIAVMIRSLRYQDCGKCWKKQNQPVVRSQPLPGTCPRFMPKLAVNCSSTPVR